MCIRDRALGLPFSMFPVCFTVLPTVSATLFTTAVATCPAAAAASADALAGVGACAAAAVAACLATCFTAVAAAAATGSFGIGCAGRRCGSTISGLMSLEISPRLARWILWVDGSACASGSLVRGAGLGRVFLDTGPASPDRRVPCVSISVSGTWDT